MWINRRQAGRELATKLLLNSHIAQANRSNMLVLSIPRGGEILGDVVARTLQCAHDVVIVKKIGFPGVEDLAIGAVAENEIVGIDREMITHCRLTKSEFNQQLEYAREKVAHYLKLFRDDTPLEVHGRQIILVDDGIATGETMKAAIHWLNKQAPEHVVVAVPITSPRTAQEITVLVDAMIYLLAPERFQAVGQYYEQFEPIEDTQVLDILRTSRGSLPGTSSELKSV